MDNHAVTAMKLTSEITAELVAWEDDVLRENQDAFTNELTVDGVITGKRQRRTQAPGDSELAADLHVLLECVKIANATLGTLRGIAFISDRLPRIDDATIRLIVAEWEPRLVQAGVPASLATEIAHRFAKQLGEALVAGARP